MQGFHLLNSLYIAAYSKRGRASSASELQHSFTYLSGPGPLQTVDAANGLIPSTWVIYEGKREGINMSTTTTATERTTPAISEQIVLVTGGARRLGRAITRAFLRQGARVVIDYVSSADAAANLATENLGRAIAVRADVRDRAQVESLFDAAPDAFEDPVIAVFLIDDLPGHGINHLVVKDDIGRLSHGHLFSD